MSTADENTALAILLAVRDIEGADVKGVGPDAAVLQNHRYCTEYDEATLLAGAELAEANGWLTIDRALGKPMIGVMITEAGQSHLDDLGFE